MPKYKMLDNRGFVPVIVLLALLGVVGGGTATAALANTSKPGDPLYGLDQAIEQLRLNTTSSEEGKSELKIEFAKERALEIKELGVETEGNFTQEELQDLESSLNTLQEGLNKEELRSVFADLREVEIKIEDDGSYKIKIKGGSGDDEFEYEEETHNDQDEDDSDEDIDEDGSDDSEDEGDEGKGSPTTELKTQFKVSGSSSRENNTDDHEAEDENNGDDDDSEDDSDEDTEDDEDEEDDSDDNDDEDSEDEGDDD